MALLKLQKSKDLKRELNEESDWPININFQLRHCDPQNEIDPIYCLLFTIFKGKAQLRFHAQNIVRTICPPDNIKLRIRNYMEFLHFSKKVEEVKFTGHFDWGWFIQVKRPGSQYEFFLHQVKLEINHCSQFYHYISQLVPMI